MATRDDSINFTRQASGHNNGLAPKQTSDLLQIAKQAKASRFLHASKWIHKYIGLVLLLFMVWMSFTGILMNHPGLISHFSVPDWLVPEQYHFKNWNRSALVDLKFSRRDSEIVFAAGKQGVWKSVDGGRSFAPMNHGFPQSDYYRKTRSLFLFEGEKDLLFAGTDGGLYFCNLRDEQWHPVRLGPELEKIKKILRVKDKLFVFTHSHAYASALPPARLEFERLPLNRTGVQNTVSLIKLFFDLHNGKAWGLPGLLLFDLTGLIILFLSISAFYTWYFPWKRKKLKRESRLLTNKRSRRLFKLMFKYHLKIGIWISVILLLIAGTGLFMRPPLLSALVGGEIPADLYPGFLPDNPWHEKIQNALYDSVDEKIIIQATDGFWRGPADLSVPFEKTQLNVPVFVMGATVFDAYGDNGFLVGSFSGIYHLQRSTGKAINLLNNQIAATVASLRPAQHMVTGYFKTPDGEEFITTHEQGLLPVGSASLRGRFGMPQALTAGFRMPLWNYLFEIHNGRFFKEWIGGWYILLVPLGALLFLLITLTGIYDWLYHKLPRKHLTSD